MSKPIIGISGSVMMDAAGIFPGYHRSYVNEDYVLSVVKNGGIPFIVPMIDDEKSVKEQVAQLDALILSGGYDVTPTYYGEEPKMKLEETYEPRDIYEYRLIKYAKEKNIPILGICRGVQILNVYHGGSLHQDLSYFSNETLKHFQGKHPDQVTHHVMVDKDSQLFEILQEEKVAVNSFHHQILNEIAPSFKVTAKAPDGVVEAIEYTGDQFILGVQWHPEMLHGKNLEMNALFKTLIEKAGKLRK